MEGTCYITQRIENVDAPRPGWLQRLACIMSVSREEWKTLPRVPISPTSLHAGATSQVTPPGVRVSSGTRPSGSMLRPARNLPPPSCRQRTELVSVFVPRRRGVQGLRENHQPRQVFWRTSNPSQSLYLRRLGSPWLRPHCLFSGGGEVGDFEPCLSPDSLFQLHGTLG